MSTEDTPEGSPPEIRKSRALSSKPCLRCCQNAGESYRKLLVAVADMVEYPLVTETGTVVLEDVGLIGYLGGSVADLYKVAKAPKTLTPPLQAPPIKPWGVGWAALAFIPGEEELAQRRKVDLAVSRMLRSIGTLLLEPEVKRPNDPKDSCEDCIQRSQFSQDKNQVKETATIRRRV